MKIIEVRDGFIKFEADKSIYLSSFIQIDGIEKSYIAQVNYIKTFGEIVLASAKILFLYDGNSLLSYDKTLPSKDSDIKIFTYDILERSIPVENPVIVGKTLDSQNNIIIDSSAFDKKMLMCVDSDNVRNTLVSNLAKQFENLGKKTIIIDTLGSVKAKKVRAGVDFKIPLDTKSLAFMYEDCLNDATSDSKSLIIDIFRDLAEYSKTVPFLPFGTLKTIVDDMVDKSHIFKLLVLKNKLAKFDRLGYFAANKKEAEDIKLYFNNKCLVIDLSRLDEQFQNRYLDYLYGIMQKDASIQIIINLSNTVSKKNLKNILSGTLPAAFLTHSKFKYLNDMKNMFDNFIIEPNFTNNQIFSVYSTYLQSMPKNSYLIAGEASNYIPLVSFSQQINDVAEIEKKEELYKKDDVSDELVNSDKEVSPVLKNENVSETEEVLTPNENSMENAVEEDFAQYVPEQKILTEEDIIAEVDDIANNAIETVTESIREPDGSVNLFNDGEEISQSDLTEEDFNSETVEILPEAEEMSDIDIDEGESIISGDIPIVESDSESLEKISEEIPEYSDSVAEIDETGDSIQEVSSSASNDEERDIIIDQDSDSEDLLLALEDNQDDLDEESEAYTEPVDYEKIESTEEIENPEEIENVEVLSVSSDKGMNDTESISELDELEQKDSELIEQEDNSIIEVDNFDFDLESTEDSENNDEYEAISESQEVDFTEPKILPLKEEYNSDDFDEIVELSPDEADENDIVVDMSDDENSVSEEDERQIIEAVDKVYTTMKDESSEEEENISDSDLDLIDELNSDETIIQMDDAPMELDESTEGTLEEAADEENLEGLDSEILEKRDSSTPIVPVYDADIPQEDMVMSDPIQQGDYVVHAKYGNGVVEKMIKYGNKTLFSINFNNIGRRLLDPTLTEIKKS